MAWTTFPPQPWRTNSRTLRHWLGKARISKPSGSGWIFLPTLGLSDVRGILEWSRKVSISSCCTSPLIFLFGDGSSVPFSQGVTLRPPSSSSSSGVVVSGSVFIRTPSISVDSGSEGSSGWISKFSSDSVGESCWSMPSSVKYQKIGERFSH